MADRAHVLPRLVAAAIACVSLLAGGCATHREISLDAQNPSVRVSRQGILFGDTFVRPEEVPEILSDYGVPKTRTIHIRLDSDVRNLGPARTLMGYLCRAGYNNPVLVTERHAESMNLGKPKKAAPPPRTSAPQSRKVRYKRANE